MTSQCVALVILTVAIAALALLLLLMVVRRFRGTKKRTTPAPKRAGALDAGGAVHDVDDLPAWLQAHPRATVLFYASWCQHCHTMLPEYAEAARQQPGATLARVQCDEQQELVSSHDLRGFPTVLRFEEGRVTQEYSGDRSASDLARFVK